MLKVANEGQPFGTRRKVTKGSLRKPDHEPEDKAKEGCRNNKKGHRHRGIGVVVNLKYQSELEGAGQQKERWWCQTASAQLFLILIRRGYI